MSCLSIGGLILDKTVSDPNFEGMAVFTPVINGEWTEISMLKINYSASVSTFRFQVIHHPVLVFMGWYFLQTKIFKQTSDMQLYG